MDDKHRATQPQIKLIESLYANLRIRNSSLYGGAAPGQLSKQRASEVIDVLTLRKLSGQLGRPVTADLTNPVQVRKYLGRVEQLTDAHHTRHAAATSTRSKPLGQAGETSDDDEWKLQDSAAPLVRPLPHLRRHVPPQPRITLTARQLAERAAELDHIKEPRLDAAGRYSDATGYGSAASYHDNNGRSPSDAPQLTDEQERKIIELQDAGDDTAVSDTVVEASEHLDQALAPAEPLPPTEKQLAYLHKLERQAGKTNEQLSHPGTRQGASRRIQRHLDAATISEAKGAEEDFAAAHALTRVTSARSIREATAADRETTEIAARPTASSVDQERDHEAHATR